LKTKDRAWVRFQNEPIPLNQMKLFFGEETQLEMRGTAYRLKTEHLCLFDRIALPEPLIETCRGRIVLQVQGRFAVPQNEGVTAGRFHGQPEMESA
jgi:hypothetical protein